VPIRTFLEHDHSFGPEDIANGYAATREAAAAAFAEPGGGELRNFNLAWRPLVAATGRPPKFCRAGMAKAPQLTVCIKMFRVLFLARTQGTAAESRTSGAPYRAGELVFPKHDLLPKFSGGCLWPAGRPIPRLRRGRR
jgi:hypothetical protein